MSRSLTLGACSSGNSEALRWIRETYSRSEIEWACANTEPNTAGLDWYPEIGFSLDDMRAAWRDLCQISGGAAAEEPAEDPADDLPSDGNSVSLGSQDALVSSCGGEYRYDNELPISVCSESASVALFQEALGVEADGYFGPGTQRALAMLQDRAGLPVTRRIDATTWAHLGVTINAPYPDLNGDGVVDASEFPE